MRTRQALPYLAVLLLLAWILGSLSRSGTSSTGILSNSYWLVYLAYLLPIMALGTMIVMILFLIINWRTISDSLGFGIAQRKRMQRKQFSTLHLVVAMAAWVIAIGVLFMRCGGLICATNSTQPAPEALRDVVTEGNPQPLPFLAGLTQTFNGLAGIVGTPFFSIAFLGLLLVSTVILARSVMVSMRETRDQGEIPDLVREEGTIAVRDALRVLETDEAADPRARIMACYERMIRAAARLGAPVSLDQTARELESGIRRTFQLKGPGIKELTLLFEEARYSLHLVTVEHSERAQKCLLQIRGELKTPTPVQS